MRKFFTLLLVCITISANLHAYNFEVGGLYYDYGGYADGQEWVYLTCDDQNWNGYAGNLTIPSNVTYNGQGYEVRGISANAFYNSYNLTSLYIPSSIQYIGDEYNNPFGYLTGSDLSITISPDNSVLTYVDNIIYSKDMKTMYWMYYNNYSSSSQYTIPSNVEIIKREAMHGHADQIILSESIETIEAYAMNSFYANSLKYQGTLEHFLQIERGERAINSGIHTIYIQNELLKSVSIPESVTAIPTYMFYNIDSIDAISIPQTVTSIGNEAFANTAFYKDGTNWENGVLYIGDCLIKVKDTCTSVVVKEGTRLIADQAFCAQDYYWSTNNNLKSVILPNSVRIIGNYAFSGCQNLTSLHFPTNLAYLGEGAFYNSGININDDSMYDEDGVLYIGGILMKAKNTISGNYRIKEGTTMIKESAFAYCQNLTSVTIPNSVTSIGTSAFYDCNSLETISIGVNVSTIGNSAFYSCDNLYSLVWNAKRCKDFSNDAQYYELPYSGTNIRSIVFGDSVEYIPANLCRERGIESVVIPDYVVEIGENAFRNSSLKEVTIGKGVKKFGKNVFQECYLTKVIWNAVHAEDLETIYNSNYGRYENSLFFSGSSYSTSYNQISVFEFGEGVEYIPANLCRRLNSLTSTYIPKTVTDIGDNAFSECYNLANVYISDLASWCAIDFKSGSNPFYSHSGNLYLDGKLLTDVIIPEGVTSIGSNAFYNCINLSSVLIPQSVTRIGANAFYNCGNTIFLVKGDVPATLPNYNKPFSTNACILVNDTAIYKSAWDYYKSRIFAFSDADRTITVAANPSISSVHKMIGDANLEKVVYLTISGSINSYDLMIMRNKMINLRFLDLTNANIVANDYEYYTGFHSEDNILRDHSFKNLFSIKLPSSLTLAENVVSECPNLRYLEVNGGVVSGNMVPSSNLSIVLNEGVTQISGFIGKSGLKNITIPASLEKIDNYTFQRCTGLQSIYIPEGITSIGVRAFEGCTSLKSIHLASSIISIGNYAFYGCSSLQSVSIPANVLSIGDYAFFNDNGDNRTTGYNHYYDYNNTMRSNSCSYAPSLKGLRFENESKLQSIGSYAFYGCQIDSLILPDSVSTIGGYAFAYCPYLKYLYISDNSKLQSIQSSAFQNCGALASIHLPKSLESIGELAFSVFNGAENKLNLILPEKVSQIGRGAFYGRGRNLTHVAFPRSLKSIEQDAFASCSALDSLSFPTSLQTIGNKAFQNCSGIKELRVPSTLLKIGDYAFNGCDNIKKVYTYTVEPVSIDQNTFSCWHNADLFVPTTSYYTYFYNTQWSQFLSLKPFDEEYSYFYINNDYELGGDNGIIDGKPDADLNEESGLIVTGDSLQEVGVITIAGDENGAASIIACEENLAADSLIIRLITKKGAWSYFCFPFDLVLDQLHFAHQYVIREYDGATRAQYGAGGWINLVGDMLQKGLGYIFQGAQTDTLTITIPNPKIGCEDYEQIIYAYNSTEAIHANWNFIGNPFPSWYDLSALFAGGFTSPVYIWNGTDYQVYAPGDDEYHFHPYEGFFTQNPNGEDMHVVWGSDGRETKSQADNKHHGNHMPARAATRRARQEADHRYLINLELASDNYKDRARVVFNNAANMDYELGRDAVKMDGGKAPLHIWTTNDGKRLSINERPYGTGQVHICYDVQEDGFYTLSASRMDTAVIIYDNELQQEVDLTQGDYTFSTEAGTNTTRFSIIRIKQQEEVLTSIDEAVVDPNETVNVYTLLGVKVLENVRRGDICLSAGVYVVENKEGARSELKIGD